MGKGDVMITILQIFWVNTDKAIPSYDEQLVKIKVADSAGDYITEGWYNHEEQKWYSAGGFCLDDNVYAWKHTTPVKKISRAVK